MLSAELSYILLGRSSFLCLALRLCRKDSLLFRQHFIFNELSVNCRKLKKLTVRAWNSIDLGQTLVGSLLNLHKLGSNFALKSLKSVVHFVEFEELLD